MLIKFEKSKIRLVNDYARLRLDFELFAPGPIDLLKRKISFLELEINLVKNITSDDRDKKSIKTLGKF